MNLDNKRIENNYDRAISIADDTNYDLLRAKNLLDAQYDDFDDLRTEPKDWKHYESQLFTLNTIVVDIIQRQRKRMNKVLNDWSKEK